MTEKISLRNKIKVLVYTFLSYAVLMGASLFYAYTQGTLKNKSALQYTTLSILVLLLFLAIYFYIYLANRKSFNGSRISLAFLSLVVITCILCLFITQPLSAYFRPFALAGLVAALIFNRRTGIFINAFTCILMLVLDLYFTRSSIGEILLVNLFLGIVLGTLFVYFATGLKKRVSIITMGIKFCGLQFALGAVISLINGFTINVLYNGLWSLGASLISMLLFMGVLPLYEYVFNFITDFRLHELCDHNNKLLIELREKAPGTFNHSIVLANLAEMCALAIGENSNLARACAYYHDIGKLSNTIYFRENQGGDKNPHDDISPEVSVNIIKNHVVNGVKKANEYKLPHEIIDIIKEHHGTLPIKVFYYKALKYTDGSLETNHFSYDGPKPKSKISAIMMISDAAEAAVRTLDKRNSQQVEKVVAEIINERMRLNQFVDCNITFKEIYTIKDVLVKTLSDVYHERIKYPDLVLGMQNSSTSNEEQQND